MWLHKNGSSAHKTRCVPMTSVSLMKQPVSIESPVVSDNVFSATDSKYNFSRERVPWARDCTHVRNEHL